MTVIGHYNLTCGKLDKRLLPKKELLLRGFERLRDSALNSTMNYCDPYGASDLREIIASKILPERGIESIKENILITNGTLHSIFLIGLMLTQRYEKPTVALEIPGYAGFRNTLRMLGVCVMPLQVDRDGAKPEPETLSQCNAVILTPEHHFPTNVTMSASRRVDFHCFSKKLGFLLIEDDYSRGFTFLGKEQYPLTANIIGDNALYIGSFSKNFAPGLRLGFIVAGTCLINQLSTIRWRTDRHSPELLQLLLSQLIRSGEYSMLERRIRVTYQQRWLMMRNLLEKHFDFKSECTGGMSFWLPTCFSWQSLDIIAAHLSSQGVWFTSGYDCFDIKPDYGIIRLGYTCADYDEIRIGIDLLAKCFRENADLETPETNERSPLWTLSLTSTNGIIPL